MNKPTEEFREFNKIVRLSREIIVTEKTIEKDDVPKTLQLQKI